MSQGDSSGSADTSTEPSATITCDQKSPYARVRHTARVRSRNASSLPCSSQPLRLENDSEASGRRRTEEARQRVARTQFKPRAPHESRNYRPIGSLRVSREGYLERKVSDDHPVPARRWVGVHRLVWEQAHGPVPPGHAVVFKPGRRTTVEAEITLDRLECITRADLMRRNSYHTNLPPEVARLVQLRGVLNRKINNRLRKQANEREGRS